LKLASYKTYQDITLLFKSILKDNKHKNMKNRKTRETLFIYELSWGQYVYITINLTKIKILSIVVIQLNLIIW